MLTLTDPPAHGRRVPPPVNAIPRGPKGLWGALASVSAPRVVARALPVSDTALLGSVRTGVMFDYDPALAISLGDEFDPSRFFD